MICWSWDPLGNVQQTARSVCVNSYIATFSTPDSARFFFSTPNSVRTDAAVIFLVQILRSQHGYLIIFSNTFCFSSVHLCIYFLEPQPIAGQTQRDGQFCVTNHPNMYTFRLWEEAGSFEPTCRVLVLLFHPPN